MTVWYKNYLGDPSQPWARQVQKEVDNQKSAFQTAEVNNVKRDAQLQSSLRQVQASAAAASQAAIDAAEAAQAASDANSTAITANNTAITANSTAITANSNALAALQDVVDLGAPGGPTINASNITAGSINAIDITGSTITGSTLTTAFSGQRVTLNSNQITFNNGSSDTGSIFGSTEGGQPATYIQGNACVISSSYGNFFQGQTGVFGASFSSENDIIAVGGAIRRNALIGGGTTGASVTDGGNFVRTSSSQRYKTDIHLLDINLNDLYAIDPKTFKRIDEVEEHGEAANTYPGFIAEELAGTSLDKFVFYSKDEEGNSRPEGIHYPELTAALLLAIKDLNTRITTLEEMIQ